MSKKEQIIDFARSRGVFRARDLAPIGISPSYLEDLARRGTIQKAGRGLYQARDFDITENHSLVEITAYVPNAIICLTSALQFHRLGTQLPAAVWIALPNFAHSPKLPIMVEVVHMNDAGLSAGVEKHRLEGVEVRIFNAAKTVADCFKYRSVVGLDIALEALKSGLQQGRVTPNDVYHYAEINRVAKVMLPYLEALNA